MSSFLRTVVGGKGYSAKPMSSEESLVSLQYEYDKLATELAETKSDLDHTKNKLKNKKNELEKANTLKDDLIQHLATTNNNNRKKTEKLQGEIEENKKLADEAKSLTVKVEAERQNAVNELSIKERQHAATKVSLSKLQRRFGRIRLLCMILAAALLIVALINWQAVMLFALSFAAFVIKVATFIVSGRA